MSGAVRIAIDGDGAAGLDSEIVARLAQLGIETMRLPAGATAIERQAAIEKCDVLVSLYPSTSASQLAIGIAAGLGAPVLILAAANRAEPQDPRGTRRFATVQDLLDAIPTGPRGRYVDEPLLRRLGACREGVDWYARRYPGGRHSSEWSAQEQCAAFADGGGRWLKTAFDRGLIVQHPMIASELAGADLSGLRLLGGDWTGAVLAGATLTNADLTDTGLARADLTRADISSAALLRCLAPGLVAVAANFAGTLIDACDLSTLRGAGACFARARVVRGSLAAADLTGAMLAGATLRAVDLRDANLSEADCTGAQFSDCLLTGARFAGSNLEGAQFIRCRPDLPPAGQDETPRH